jgi:hypothetical protein
MDLTLSLCLLLIFVCLKIAYFHELSCTYEIWIHLNFNKSSSHFSLDVIRWHCIIVQAAFRHARLRWAWCRSSAMWRMLLSHSDRFVSLVSLLPQAPCISSTRTATRLALSGAGTHWPSRVDYGAAVNPCVPLSHCRRRVEWIESSRSGLA